MHTYIDLVQLARICLKHARETTHPSLRDELKRMAKEYQQRAANLDSGELPDIGEGGGARL
jgi:hypothetical protein